MCAWNILVGLVGIFGFLFLLFYIIFVALRKLWHTLSNRNANSNDTQSSEDDNCTPASVVSRRGGDRQGYRFQSSSEEENTPKSTCETYGNPRSQSSFGEDNIHPQGVSIVSAQESKSECTYSSDGALDLPSDKESTQPRQRSTHTKPETTQKRERVWRNSLPAASLSNLNRLAADLKLLQFQASVLPSKSPTNEKRILTQQAVRKHISSHYVQNLRRQDSLDVDEFLRRQLSSNRNACLPYRPDVINIWFCELVTRVPTAEPEGMPLRADVIVINLMKTNDHKRIRSAVATFRSISFKDGEELHFHATDAQSAKYILENGIDLTKCKGRHDFSNGYGFYVSTDYTKATEWAIRKGRKVCNGAIIAFKVSRQLRNEKPYLRLGVSTAERRRDWEKIVSHFRNGLLSGKLHDVKFIRGPVGRNAFLRPGEKPVPFDFTQICICDEEYAKRYGSLKNICFVIFFKVN